MADKNTKTAQKWYKKDYDMHIEFKPRSKASDCVLVERLPLMASAAGEMAYGRHFKLLSAG